VLSCSSLKRRYRDLLRSADPALRFAHLAGPRELIASRMAARKDHYMPTTLLDSQLAALEPLQDDEAGIVLDIGKPPAELVQQILHI
jgi:gluconokinase/shikimate kinase